MNTIFAILTLLGAAFLFSVLWVHYTEYIDRTEDSNDTGTRIMRMFVSIVVIFTIVFLVLFVISALIYFLKPK